MDRIKELLADLKKNSIDIELEDGELEVFYDGEDLDPIIYDRIKASKDELIKFLAQEKRNVNMPFSILPAPYQANYPLSLSQYRLWVISQLDGGNSAYNISGIYEFEGLLNIDLIESSFKLLIERHEILRTIFKEDEQGEVRQYILDSSNINFNIGYRNFQTESNTTLISEVLENELHTSFNLAEGLLIKVNLLQITQTKYIFCLVMHHIISDGWSIEIMIKELFAFYRASEMGEPSPFQPLRLQYKDYAVWQQELSTKQQLEKNKKYWLDQFTGEIPLLALPSQKQRPAIKTYNGATINKTIDQHLSVKLKEITQSEGSTLFMGLLSIVNILFYKYTQQEDIIVGSAIAGREYFDLDDQIGFFVNTLALRTRFDKEDSFISLLRKVKDIALGAYEHQIYALDELLGDLSLKRDLSRNALFDVMVDLQSNVFENTNDNAEDSYIRSFKIKPYTEVKTTTSRFDLHFNFSETARGLAINLNYNTDIYSEDFMIQMLNHLEQIMSQVLFSPTLSISKAGYLNETEKKKLLLTFNDTKANYLSENTIVDCFELQVKRTPDNIAVVFEDIKLTYKELNEKANQFAHYLQEVYTVRPEDLIGVKLDKSEFSVIVLLALLKSGAAYVPIDPNYPQERINFIEKDSKCKVIIDHELMLFYNLERFKYKSTNPESINKSSDLAYVIYTSGSTGWPKGVMVTHTSLVNMISDQIRSFEISEKDLILWFSSISFDASLYEIMISLFSGASLHIPTNEIIKDKYQMAEFLETNQITVMTLPPSYLDLFSQKDISGLRCIITAGESANPVKAQEVVNSGINYYNAYGPTECAVCVSFYKVRPNDSDKKTVCIGKPISNTTLYILDNDLNLVPPGVIGNIFISGSGLARGYLNRPELTDEKFISNPFIERKKMFDTGDLGSWTEEGNISFFGRRDHQVKIRGFRIELGEIESTISEYSADLDHVVVEVKENHKEKVLVAYLVSPIEIDKSELRNFLQSKLPDYMIPSFYIMLKVLPLTPNGKIDRKSLPDISGDNIIRKEYVEPKNEIEQKLVEIWSEVLNIKKEEIGIKDDFFELGGHSLKVMQVIYRIKNEFIVNIKVEDFFNNSNVELVSKIIIRDKWAAESKAFNAAEEIKIVI